MLKETTMHKIRAYCEKKQTTVTLFYNTIFEAKKRNRGLMGFEYVG